MTVRDLPTVNAILNSASALLLIWGRVQIIEGRPDRHKRIMLTALSTSILFLLSYTIYHSIVGSIPYMRRDWTRPVYFAILIPHVTLAGTMVPFILLALLFAWRQRFEAHKKVTRWLWPVWMFVSVSGILVYFMLYHL